MSNVRSAPMENERRGALPAPLPRGWIDDALPIFRALLGAAFVAFSSYATVVLFAGDIQPIVGDAVSIGIMADRYWAGLLLALVFFIGEIVTAEHAPAVYGIILLPDTFYTARQMRPGFLAFLLAYDAVGAGLCAAVSVWGLLLAEGKSARWAFAGGILAGLTGWGIMGVIEAPAWLWIGQAWVFAFLNGYLVARFGETLLFGGRR
jgi:hypothetical protein